ncbi:ankyrin repeat domain-containing protein [Nostoc sp. FACHB-133]|uniref:ankyrin repeat domain-containing protein n=1 Tax=Nostoc sp. FACHB-133 TaxID=2692835 RepID=UPI0016826E89|nr:ankyrin repeat domain-containing protein [Nostoc sp. FACHB-133]MBD2525853.1 ankyrin repeat domain-containing protein [Nostoc sp. FACHB-133]
MDTNLLTQEIKQAIENSDQCKLESLFASDPFQINATTVFGNWLHFAVSFNASIETIKYLVEKGVDFNEKAGILKGNILNIAAAERRIDVVNYLLEKGAEIDISEPERNPLFSAIYSGNIDIVEVLIKHKIDFKIKYSGDNMNNMDALEFAKERGQIEIAEMLSALYG